MRLEEGLQEIAHPVNGLQRVQLVGNALELARVDPNVDKTELADEGQVRLVVVVRERRAAGDPALAERFPGHAAVGSAEPLVDKRGPARVVNPDADAQLVLGRPAGQLPVRPGCRVLGGKGPVGLVYPDPAREHDVVLDALEHGEQLRHPIGRGGVGPPVFPGHGVDALERHRLEHEVRPSRDGQLGVFEDRPRHRREVAPAGFAGVPLQPVAVLALPGDLRAPAVRAAVAGVAVVELGVALEVVMPEVVYAPAGAHHGALGGVEIPLGCAVPWRGRGRAPASLLSAQGGSPVRLGRTVPRQDYHIRRKRHRPSEPFRAVG